eukprot:symbB.v1.2.010519.t4/scaffold690.1/size332707/17
MKVHGVGNEICPKRPSIRMRWTNYGDFWQKVAGKRLLQAFTAKKVNHVFWMMMHQRLQAVKVTPDVYDIVRGAYAQTAVGGPGIQLVIFGDSYSDGGYLGQGIAALDRSDAHRDPMEDVLYTPLQKIAEYFGSKIYMKELGFYEGCATDGLPWPYHVGVKKVMNFACGGSTTCQYVEKLVEVPPGYVAMPSVGSMAGYEYHHRGIAQQIQWAAATLPQEIWSDQKTWIILGPLSNDVIYHGAQAIGSTTSEACRCPFVQNHRQMLEDLANLGVTSDRIISCGLIPLDLLPGLQGDLDLVWFRAQQEAVNRCLDAMLKHPRWPLDKLIRGLWSEAPAVKCYVYEALPFLRPEDLQTPMKLRGSGDVMKFQLFDEFHPNAATHELFGRSLAEVLEQRLSGK